MAELKTRKNDKSVKSFLDAVQDDTKRQDCYEILELMTDVTGEEPKMWGDTIVGFGEYTYNYESGRSGQWMATGFAPRAQALTLYIMPGFDRYSELMEKLGKHKTGKSCLYIKRLSDVDRGVLRELVDRSFQHVTKRT